jgi:hypothetical protein
MAHRLPPAQARETGSQDLGYLAQALVGSHEIGREGITAHKALIEMVRSFAGALIHRGAVDLLLDDSGLSDQLAPSRSIQPRTVRGSLSSSRAMSSIDCPSPCRRTALACRLR